MADLHRRALLGTGAGVALAGLIVSSNAEAETSHDAELIRVCHAFAEAEFRNWWRYVIAPDNLADAQDHEPDWATLEWIETTPATTPTGWHAKALAYAAWWREAYDNAEFPESDSDAPLLASLLRDMVAPARAEILARCAADYGPLPDGYTADGRWIGRAPAVTAAVPLVPLHADAELLATCDAFSRAEAEVARLERNANDDVFEPAVAVSHAAVVRVSGLRAHTVAGLRAKVAVCRAVYAADEPAAMIGTFGGKAQRHDVLAWSTLSDLAEVAAG
ncbi:MAG: hypothetical protein ACRYG8_52480 [Janthinobacterium lividum]